MFKPGQILKFGRTGKKRYIFNDYHSKEPAPGSSFTCTFIDDPVRAYIRRKYVYHSFHKWMLATKPKPIIFLRSK